MEESDAVSWDFDGIMSALRDSAQRLPLLKEVEKWSSENVDAILVLAKQGQLEKAWTQMADTLNQIARDKFRRTTSAVPPEIRQTCREALAATCSMSSKLDNLGCGASTETGIQMCPTLGTDSCFGTASSALL